jgi:hypothetical protein
VLQHPSAFYSPHEIVTQKRLTEGYNFVTLQDCLTLFVPTLLHQIAGFSHRDFLSPNALALGVPTSQDYLIILIKHSFVFRPSARHSATVSCYSGTKNSPMKEFLRKEWVMKNAKQNGILHFSAWRGSSEPCRDFALPTQWKITKNNDCSSSSRKIIAAAAAAENFHCSSSGSAVKTAILLFLFHSEPDLLRIGAYLSLIAHDRNPHALSL